MLYELFIIILDFDWSFHQVRGAWDFNRTRHHWVDLGVHTEAYMTRPETCGAAGGAINLWVNIIDCPSGSGIISSNAKDSWTASSFVYCYANNVVYDTFFLMSFVFQNNPN